MAQPEIVSPSSTTTTTTTIPSAMNSVVSLTLPIATKLSSTNYLTWKSQILPVLHGYSLSKYIASLPPNPTITADDGQILPNPESPPWHCQDQLLLGWLRSSLTEIVQAQVVNCATSFELWNSLQSIFSNKSRARLADLRRQIQTASKGGMSCSDYIHHMRRLADELLFIGSPIPEDELVDATLNGLGSDYLPFVTSITTTHRSDPISFSELHGLLLTHEALLLSQHTSIGSPSAFTNFRQNNRNQTRYYNNQPQNYSQNRQNNNYQPLPALNTSGTTPNCKPPLSPKSTNSMVPPRSQSGPKVLCQICAKPGHPAKLCYFRYEPDPNWKPNPKFQAFAAQVPASSTDSQTWVLDSGATNHVTSDLNNLSSFFEYAGSDTLQVGNGAGLPIQHTGDAFFSLSNHNIKLSNILHVPSFTCNLISISKLISDNPNLLIEFSNSYCIIKLLPTMSTLLQVPNVKGLYAVKFSSSPTAFYGVQASATKWHYRLGHPSKDVTLNVVNRFQLPCISNKLTICHDCSIAKAHRLPFTASSSVSTFPLEIIHSDVWGPSPILSHNGFRYYVVFIDDYSKYTWVYFLKNKHEVPHIFSQFKAQVENLLQSTIKILRTDGGTEFKPIAAQHPQITHQTSCPYTPQQNGVAERKHRHLIELALANMAHAHIPMVYWDEIVSSMAFLINRLPNHSHVIPYEVLFKKQPDYSQLKVLGCLCFPYTRPYNKNKLEPRSLPCIFIGYTSAQKGYMCLHVPTNRVYVSRHVEFDEESYPFQQNQKHNNTSVTEATVQSSLQLLQPIIPLEPISTTQPTTSNNVVPSNNSPPQPVLPSIPDNTTSTATQNTPILQTSQAHQHTPQITQSVSTTSTLTSSKHPMTTRTRDNTIKTKKFPHHVSYIAATDTEPTCFSKAVSSPEWRQAMALEIDALARNNTWVLVPPPDNQSVIGCKWVYKLKHNSDGSINRHKARLVAKGYNQIEGVDFFETYSPVVRPATIRLLLSLAVSSGWPVKQLDVHNAFLHGELSEEVFMQQPQGFVDKSFPDYVCKLKKSLYGLKQAPRAWFQKLSSTLTAAGFHASQYDPSLFICHISGQSIFILIYVDDILITGSDKNLIQSCISHLHTKFALKDLGNIHYFLGIEALHCSNGLFLNQTKYIENILTKTKMMEAKPCTTPMATFITLSANDSSPFEDPHLYRSVVGALQYATLTRPEISFAVNKCSQFMHTPTQNHWVAVKRVLRYLRGTLKHGIMIHSHSSSTLHAYSDADWAGSTDDRRSTSGFCLFLGKNLISWSSKKQPTVSRSSTEAEYRSLALTCTEILWIQNLLKELQVNLSEPPTLWCDNIGATFLASNPSFHARTKHIEIDYHFVRERIINKELLARFLCSADQIADILTKPLPTIRHQFLTSKLNVLNSTLACGGCVNSTLDNSS
ncbi:hypothetical protein LUZ61_007788 [Rhynchospora tenuis]|uniref:Integrase catalytic domain-containing protein n=1 Tax=Rhynchospora tenuis TaxID=198213 RepID=A0AAD6EWU8_9POAL|nr:hypothetical protein LUZ61_007788 [Rhynchospora tenuis]